MINNEMLKCPVCSNILSEYNHSYVCSNKHTFDIASKGYVNLLMSHQKSSKEPGDNKQMVVARNSFLNRGFYKNLSETVNSIVMKHIESIGNVKKYDILDSGCGEGYYIDSLDRCLKDKNIAADLLGIDISKDAIKLASSRNRNICFAIASSFNIPACSNTIDYLLQIFSPCSNEEFERVINDKGILISVIPGKKHLFGLKEVLYDQPYENDEVEYPLTSFKVISQKRIEYDINLEDTEDIRNLLMMTPYYWRTNEEKISKLNRIESLKTPVEFMITAYSKKQR